MTAITGNVPVEWVTPPAASWWTDVRIVNPPSSAPVYYWATQAS